MSLYKCLALLLIFSLINGEELKIGFMLFPAQKKSQLARVVFNKYIQKWQDNNSGMTITVVDGSKEEFPAATNPATLKSYIETEGVKIVFGFCFGINKIGTQSLDEYLRSKNAHIFCATTQDNACTTNVVNVQDGGIYYSRALLNLAYKWKKFVIVAQATVKDIMERQLKGICATEKCNIIKSIDTTGNTGLQSEIENINDDDFAIIINTVPTDNPAIYGAVNTLKVTNNKNVQAYGFGNIELNDNVANSEGTEMISLISDSYTNEKKVEMMKIVDETVTETSGTIGQEAFQYLYLIYTLLDSYFSIASQLKTFDIDVILNNLKLYPFDSPISKSYLEGGNAIRNSQYLYQLGATVDDNVCLKNFTDFEDFSYISPWNRIGEPPIGECDWKLSPTNGTVDGNYAVIIFIVPYSDKYGGKYQQVGIDYSRIVNSYLHELNRNGGVVGYTIIAHFVDGFDTYENIKRDIDEVINKYKVIAFFLDTLEETHEELHEAYEDQEILFFNLHNIAGFECHKFHYSLGFSSEQVRQIHYLAFDLVSAAGRTATFLLYSDNGRDRLQMEMYRYSLEQQGSFYNMSVYFDSEIEANMTAAPNQSVVVLSLSFEDTIKFLEYLKASPTFAEKLQFFFINTYEPVFLSYKDDPFFDNIHLLTQFAPTKNSPVLDRIKEEMRNYYKLDEGEEYVYGYMGLAYVGLEIWNTTAVLTGSIEPSILYSNIYKQYSDFVNGPYSIDVSGYAMLNVVIEHYDSDPDVKNFVEEFSTDYAILPETFANTTKVCDLTRPDGDAIYEVKFYDVFAVYSFHDPRSRYYINQLRLIVSYINQKGGFDSYRLKLEYVGSPAYVIPRLLQGKINSGISLFVGTDDMDILDQITPIIEKNEVFLINPHFARGDKCYQHIIHTGMLSAQIFPRIIQVSGAQGDNLVILSNGTTLEKSMVMNLQKEAKTYYGDELELYETRDNETLSYAVHNAIFELNTTSCAVSCTIIALRSDTALAALSELETKEMASRFHVMMISPNLKKVNAIYDKMPGMNMIVDSFVFKIVNAEANHFLKSIEQNFGPKYIINGETMAMYEGFMLLEKAISQAPSKDNEDVLRELLGLGINTPSGSITLKPSMNVERKLYISGVGNGKPPGMPDIPFPPDGSGVPGGLLPPGVLPPGFGGDSTTLDPNVLTDVSNHIYPMLSAGDFYCDWSDETILGNGTYPAIKVLLLFDKDEKVKSIGIVGYLKELIEQINILESIHYSPILSAENCPTTKETAASTLIDYNYLNYHLVICDCPMKSLELMDSPLQTISMVIFYIRPSLRSHCTDSIWYMDITPIQHIKPTLFWAFEEFGSRISVVYSETFDVTNYLSLISSFSSELDLEYEAVKMTDDVSTYRSLIVNQLQFILNDGYIIDLLPEKLSKQYNSVYNTIVTVENRKILTFFTYTVKSEENEIMNNHYFITSSYPAVVTDEQYLKNSVPYMTMAFFTPPNVLLAADALKAIFYIYQAYPNPTIDNFKQSLIGVEFTNFQGSITFDSSHYLTRPLYAVLYKTTIFLPAFEVTQLGQNWPPNPFYKEFNSFYYEMCDIRTSLTTNKIKYFPVGVVQSFTGELTEYSRGLAAVIAGECETINSNGGINGYYLTAIVYNDNSDPFTAQQVFYRMGLRGIKYVFGLTDTTIRKYCIPYTQMYEMVLYYPANIEGHECVQSVFSTGIVTNDLLNLPYYIKTKFTPKVYLVLMNSDKAKAELEVVQNRLQAFGIPLVGKYFVYTDNTDFVRVSRIIVNTLNTGGVILSMLRGKLSMELFKGCYGILKSTMVIISEGISEDDLNQGYGYTAENHYIWIAYSEPEATSKYYQYFLQLKSKLSYKKSFGELHANTYNAFLTWYNGVKKAGSFETSQVIKACENLEFDTISGSVVMDSNHYLRGRGSLYQVKFDMASHRYRTVNQFPDIKMNYKTDVYSMFDETQVRICDWSMGGYLTPEFVKIGIFGDITGTNSEYELIIVMAAISSIQTINEEGGVLNGIYIIPIIRNTMTDKLLSKIADEFLKDPKIVAIVGGKSEDSRHVVSSRIAAANSDVLLFYPAKSLGSQCSSNVVQVGSTLNQFIDPVFNFLLSVNAQSRLVILDSDDELSFTIADMIEAQYSKFITSILRIRVTSSGLHSVAVAKQIFDYLPKKNAIISCLSSNDHLELLDQINNILRISLKDYYMYCVIPDTKDVITNPAFANNYFYSTYDLSSTSQKHKEMLDQWVRHSFTTFLSEDGYNAYLGVNLWKAAVIKSGSTNPTAVKLAMQDVSFESPNGLVSVDTTFYTSHHIRIGYMDENSNFVVGYKPESIYPPEPYNWYVNPGYTCDVRYDNPTVSSDYGYILFSISSVGDNSEDNMKLPIIISAAVQRINGEGGVIGKHVVVTFFDDQGDYDHCSARLKTAYNEIKNGLLLILYGSDVRCLADIKSDTIIQSIPIVFYSAVGGETCDANIIYFDVEPSFYERAYNRFLTRNYKKYAIVAGLDDRYHHAVYAEVYLAHLFQHVKYIGNLTSHNRDEIVASTMNYLGNEEDGNSALLYFGVSSLLHPFIDALKLNGNYSSDSVSIIVFDGLEMEGDYDYEMVGTYFSEIQSPVNQDLVASTLNSILAKPTYRISKIFSFFTIYMQTVHIYGVHDYTNLFNYIRGSEYMTTEGLVKVSNSNYGMFYMRFARHSKDGVRITYTSTDVITPNPYKYLSNEGTFYECIISKNTISNKLPKSKYTILVVTHLQTYPTDSLSVVEGALLAQQEINLNGGTLSYYIAIDFYNLDDQDSYNLFVNAINMDSNVYIVGFTLVPAMQRILSFFNSTDLMFLSTWTLTEAYCVTNIIATETTGPQLAYFLSGVLLQKSPIAYLVYSNVVTSISYLITTKYIIPTLEYYGITIESSTAVDPSITDLTNFWSNSEMIIKRKGCIISTVGGEYDIYLLKSFKSQGFNTGDIHILFTSPPNEFFVDQSLTSYLEGHFASGSFLDGIDTTDNLDIEVAPDARQFLENIENNFGSRIKANAASEAAYTSVYYIHNAITYTRSTDVVGNIKSLSEVVVQSPAGNVELDKSNSLARRLFVIKFTESGPSLYYSPNGLSHSLFYSDYYNLTDVEICSFNPISGKGKIIKNVVVIHEYDSNTMKEETNIARTIDLFITKTETDFNLNGYVLNFYNVYGDKDSIEEKISKAIEDYKPIALLGGRKSFLLPIMSRLTQDSATPYFYYGLDDLSVCKRNFFYFQSDYYQRFDIANQYIMNLTFTDSVVIYDDDSDDSFDEFKKLFDKNNSPLLAAINVTTDEGMESILTVLPSLLTTKLSHIAVYVLLQSEHDSHLRNFLMKNKQLFDNSNYIFVFKECNPFYWTGDQYLFFNGHMCIDTLSNNEDSTESTVFRTEAYNLFGNNRGDSEINSLVYSSLFLLANAINNVMIEHTKNSFPNADYINQALKEYNMAIPNGLGKIANSGILITTYFIKSISQYGFDSVEYPTNGVIYIDPKVDCDLGRLVKIYTYPDSLISSYLIYVLVVIYLISVFYFYTKNRHNPIVRNTSYLFSVIAMFALFLLSTCSMIILIYPKNDFTCAIRKWFILISLDLLLSTFVMKVWRIHKLMNNKQLNKMRISDGRLLMVIAGVIAVQIVYLLIWTLVSPVRHQKELNTKLSDFITDVYVRNCESEEYFLIPQGIGILALAAWGVQVAFKIRTVVAEFNESLSLISTIVILCIWALAMLGIDFALADEPTALAFIRTMGINVGVFVVAFLQFGNKVSLLYCANFGPDDDSSSSSEGEGEGNGNENGTHETTETTEVQPGVVSPTTNADTLNHVEETPIEVIKPN